jgi:WD40 repeat protein
VAKDYLELRRVDGVDLTDATEMRQFVGKYMDVLQRDKGAAVMQLALQQPDASAVFRAAVASQLASKQSTRALMWRNKSQEKDACIGTLSHKDGVSSVAVGATRIVSGSGNSIFVYDAESQELLEELQGTSNVTSVDIWDGGKDGGKHTNKSKSLIVACYMDGTIKVWDSGAPEPLKSPLYGQN